MNILEAKEIMREEQVRLTEGLTNISEWQAQRDRIDEAESVLISAKYDHPMMKKVIKLSQKLDNMEQEEGYEEAYHTSRDKAQKLINSARLSAELKIKSLEQELREIKDFEYEVRRGDFSCLEIGLVHVIEDELNKEEAES